MVKDTQKEQRHKLIRSEYENKIICGDWIEKLKELPAGIFHSVITSPPYWGQRDYGTDGQLGLEENPELHIQKLVEGFREVYRVLRDDGVLWLIYGDKYTGGGNGGGGKQDTNPGSHGAITAKCLPDGNLLMLPSRVALALQADGWILRDDISWAKAISSFGMHVCPHCGIDLYNRIDLGNDLLGDNVEEIINRKKSGSCMPESANGWRWERCRVKVKAGWDKNNPHPSKLPGQKSAIPNSGGVFNAQAKWQDCPGCDKCEPNGGYVLRKGSWRCTKAHEYLFQFVKTNDYFCDAEAVKEESGDNSHNKGSKLNPPIESAGIGHADWHKYTPELTPSRNLRNVWTINPRGYKEAHYATFPEDLVEPMIKVSTSQKGVCPNCGAPWARVVDSKPMVINRSNRGEKIFGNKPSTAASGTMVSPGQTTTLGWRPTCGCNLKLKTKNSKLELEPVPALVGDCFMGSGTTAVVAARLGRNYWGCDINPNYVKNHAEIRVKAAETGLKISEIQDGQKGLFETAAAAHERGKPAPAAMERSQ